MLLDLDELVLTCRGPRAKQYIAESVAAYKAGAYRSSIVATWIAVVFDFIDKLRELDSSQDKRAAQHLEKILGFQGRVDPESISASQDFERTLLDVAVKDFELLTPVQQTDLRRLQEDRNRCAHPSLQADDIPYSPSAELARYHITCAIQYLLSQPPVQGKAALTRLLSEVQSPLFPRTARSALRHFKTGPLARASQPLVRNLFVATLKLVLAENTDDALYEQGMAALTAIKEMYRGWAEEALNEKLPDAVRSVPDESLLNVLIFLRDYPEASYAVDEANRLRLREFVKSAPRDQASDVIGVALQIKTYAKLAKSRLDALTDHDVTEQLETEPLPALLDEAVRRFTGARTFDASNRMGRTLILPFVSNLSGTQIEAIRQAILDNNQILGSIVAPRVIQAILQHVDEHTEEVIEPWSEFYRKLRQSKFAEWDEGVLTALEQRFPQLAAGEDSSGPSSEVDQ